MDFLKKYGSLITIASLLVTLIAGYVKVEVNASTAFLKVQELETKVQSHHEDYQRHVDPKRDDARWQDLNERLARFERSIERLEQTVSAMGRKL